VAFARGSGNRLTSHDRGRFPGDSLFERLARVVCEAGCLPRKELYEAWEVARRVRRVFRGGRVIDMGGGHGLLAHVLLLLDDSSPAAIVVDPLIPKSARTLHDLLVQTWPRLDGRVEHLFVAVEDVALDAGDVVVSCHACGALTDLVLSRATTARARVAVLPCCHDEETCDMGGLGGWLESSLAIDVVRAARLEASGYRVWTQTIPVDITPKNRLLLGAPVGPALRTAPAL
jgi:hypothetical protein